jgi:hypothetical protein
MPVIEEHATSGSSSLQMMGIVLISILVIIVAIVIIFHAALHII